MICLENWEIGGERGRGMFDLVKCLILRITVSERKIKEYLTLFNVPSLENQESDV